VGRFQRAKRYGLIAVNEAIVSELPRRVLVVVGGLTGAAPEVVEALRSKALDLIAVASEREALARLGRGETPSAVLLLDCLQHRPNCYVECKRGERARADCIIDCIREHRRLELVPVMHYSPYASADPGPDELASLILAAATMTQPRLPACGESAAARAISTKPRAKGDRIDGVASWR
jgi:hypothetical protein